MDDDPPGPKRLPLNAHSPAASAEVVYSTSPQAIPSMYRSLTDTISFPPSSLTSEVDVIMDDGTVQKRSVSLSTIPDQDIPVEEESPWLFSTHPPRYERDDTRSAGSSEHSDEESSSSSDEDDSDSPFFPPQPRTTGSSYVFMDRAAPVPWYKVPATCFRYLLGALRLTPRGQLVLKCSFAYLLGSLFTFIPALNALIGNNRTSSHLVATATVFFNPAKTLGGMVEAAAYGWGYTLFALLVCMGSMLTTDHFVDQGQFIVAHAISLFVWLAGSTFVVAFLKAHWNKPPVATASSLCFIIIFIIVVREGSANKGDFDTTRIQEIYEAIAIGAIITITSCAVFWPSSASKKLRNNIDTALSSYRILLKLLTKTFLLDDDLPEFKANRTLQKAIDDHRASFTALQKSLQEARFERVWNGHMRKHEADYAHIVENMERLAQYMGGLRSSCGLQFEFANQQDPQTNGAAAPKSSTHATETSPLLARQATNASSRQMKRGLTRSRTQQQDSWNIRAGFRRRKIQDQLKRTRTLERSRSMMHYAATDVSDDAPLGLRSDSFENNVFDEPWTVQDDQFTTYISSIKKPLKSLAYTCKQTLYHLQTRFATRPSSSANDKLRIPTIATLRANLNKAIALFEVSQRRALHHLHQQKQENQGPTEQVFLVYFFVFNMVEFARHLVKLVDAVGRLEQPPQRQDNKKGLKQPAFTEFEDFIPNERNQMDTLHTPVPKTAWRRFFIRLWQTLSLFKQQKLRYAIKATVAAILLAIPAFLESTNEWFREWRMEWALITLMVVMTPTVGGTNIVAVYRIFSTILGCYSAVALYQLFPGNMVMLPLVTWLFSIPNFWLILNHKHGKFGQFTLLAYNLVMLNKYNDRETDRIEVWELAFQRCVSILVGVVFGLVATAYVWPYEARVELRKGISDLLLRLAWLYQKLVAVYSERPVDKPFHPVDSGSDDSDNGEDLGCDSRQRDHRCRRQLFLTPDVQRKLLRRTFMRHELALQRELLFLQDLLNQTPNEPRLKGQFPVATYRIMLDSCQNIVDKFLSMRMLILRDTWFDDIQSDFILPVASARREMVGNVLLYFYLLASALHLKTPLPPYFPPAKQAWKRLLGQLREISEHKQKLALEKDYVYIFYYAYVTMMEDIIRELDKLGDTMTHLFGSIIPHDQWEHLFATDIEQQQASVPLLSSSSS
ncbi:Fusaric acid resistance protein-like-domain-containing protein [Gongronella butleri]|nr:Fusaric acid resistance protein-like-domain-containing protein [Gongronella butleri]